ncbi:Ig-like domain-containing protein [Actinoplanes sp. HUAS TT8]|uniref:Ig-like domain-containing protein n=1 Tax=Actinoplanes sp. HUAS TT8 TaxID=3447453 RepID=UPI003F51BD4E
MPHHSIFRWALGGLTATALSVAGLSTPAYADTPTLIAGDVQTFSAAPGGQFNVTLSATNTGTAAVDGVVVTFDTMWAYEDLAQFSNCEYTDAGQARACVFDQTLEPGKSYRFTVPFRVRADSFAPKVRDAFFQWKPAAGHTSAGTPGTGSVLQLQEGDQLGLSEDGDWQHASLAVTGDQGTDLAAIGATPAGWIGDVVEAEVGVRNNGPATLDFTRSGTQAAVVVVTPPSGTSIVSAPGCLTVTAARATCLTGYLFKVGEVKTWKLALRIDRKVADAAGAVEVNPDCTCDSFAGDIDKSNNKALLTVDAAVDETKPVIDYPGLDANQVVSDIVTIKPRVSDNVKVTKLEITGAPAQTYSTCTAPATSSDSWQCKVTQLAGPESEADNVLTFKAYDAAGNVSDPVVVPVHVDNKSPRFTVSPAPRSSLHSGTIFVSLDGVPADVKTVQVLDSKTDAVIDTLTGAPWTYDWDATTDATPPAFLAVDQAGNPWHVSTDYVVDDEAPVIDHVDNVVQYMTSRLDTGTGWVGSLGSLEYTATDKSPITRTEWRVNGVVASTTPTFLFNTHSLTAATAKIELRVTDAAGNTSAELFTVNIDKTVTGVTVLPTQNKLIRGTSYVTSVTVNDPHGKAYSTIVAPTYIAGSRSSAKITAGKDGTKTIIWEVSDRLGNVAQFRRTVIVDNTAPTVSLRSAPKNNAKVTRNFSVTLNASDKNGVGRVELLINGKRVATDYRAGWGFTINPKKYGKKFTVQLRVYDKAGNSKLSTKRTYRR